MSHIKIPLNTALIDSLSLEIPFEDCIIYDKRLISETAVYYYALGMYEDEPSPPKPIIIENNAQTVRISLVKRVRFIDGKAEQRKFIQLTVSAKLLTYRYFDGINLNNIGKIYKRFIEFKVFYCDFETFLNSHCIDVDICYNLKVANNETYDRLIDVLYNASGIKQKYLHKFTEKYNKGLDMNKRRDAKPSLPYVKLYHKELELMTKSAEFWNHYLFPQYGRPEIYDQEIKNITRVEATIKNSAHKKRLKKKKILPYFSSLKELLEIETSDLMRFVSFSVHSYINKERRVKSPNLSPTDHLLFNLVADGICMGATLDYMQVEYTKDFVAPKKDAEHVAKSRMRKKLAEMYNLAQKSNEIMYEKTLKNEHMRDYLKQLDIDWVKKG